MKRRIFSLIALLWAVNSHAYTECNTSIIRFYTGDDGVLWMIFADGLSAYTTSSADPVDSKNFLAVLTTALVADKNLTVRFTADGVPCTNGPVARGDIIGIWLHK